LNKWSNFLQVQIEEYSGTIAEATGDGQDGTQASIKVLYQSELLTLPCCNAVNEHYWATYFSNLILNASIP
jgi:hypothetical protein